MCQAARAHYHLEVDIVSERNREYLESMAELERIYNERLDQVGWHRYAILTSL